MKCNRCNTPITPDNEESCWYCPKSLCYECWDEYGHCGHKEADAINKKAWEQRKKVSNG